MTNVGALTRIDGRRCVILRRKKREKIACAAFLASSFKYSNLNIKLFEGIFSNIIQSSYSIFNSKTIELCVAQLVKEMIVPHNYVSLKAYIKKKYV